MPNLEMLTSPQDFEGGWWLDWCEDPDPDAMPETSPPRTSRDLVTPASRAMSIPDLRAAPVPPNGRIVSGKSDYYRYATGSGTLSVNLTGPEARARYCSKTQIDGNLCDRDGLLVASNLNDSGRPEDAPIRLSFQRPLRAVGSYMVGKEEGQRKRPVPFTAMLWVRLFGMPGWHPACTAHGSLDGIMPAGELPSAPFVGVRMPAGLSIAEAAFDVAPLGNRRFGQVAIGELYGIV